MKIPRSKWNKKPRKSTRDFWQDHFKLEFAEFFLNNISGRSIKNVGPVHGYGLKGVKQ